MSYIPYVSESACQHIVYYNDYEWNLTCLERKFTMIQIESRKAVQ